MANAAQLIEMSQTENRTVTEYPETDAEAVALLEALGVEADDNCAVWDHHSGAGYSGPEAVGHYDVFGADWRVHVVTREVSSVA